MPPLNGNERPQVPGMTSIFQWFSVLVSTSGGGGRWFKSTHSDQRSQLLACAGGGPRRPRPANLDARQCQSPQRGIEPNPALGLFHDSGRHRERKHGDGSSGCRARGYPGCHVRRCARRGSAAGRGSVAEPARTRRRDRGAAASADRDRGRVPRERALPRAPAGPRRRCGARLRHSHRSRRRSSPVPARPAPGT